MNALLPDAAVAEAADHDLIVVGGGITGACLALEAARRGLRPLLLERAEFGEQTSANSLRILHGGLRYLQTLDLPRFFRSVGDRRWFCRHFPELVAPLPCVMPLQDEGLRRRPVLAVALAVNDLLSARRNVGVPRGARLPRGRLLSRAQTLKLCPALPRSGLRGGALWYDAVMTSAHGVLIEILRWATHRGGVALDHTMAISLIAQDGMVAGVEAEDARTGGRSAFRAPVVVNCAGPWAGGLADSFGSAVPDLFAPSLAFNLLIDRPPVAPVALALRDPGSGHTYFVLPWRGKVLAGTEHVAWDGAGRQGRPSAEQVDTMLMRLRGVVPGLGDVTRTDVVRVMSGVLPAARPGAPEPRSSDILVDHGRRGGPKGLHSVVGVKYTTAPRLARRALDRIYGRARPAPASGPRPAPPITVGGGG